MAKICGICKNKIGLFDGGVKALDGDVCGDCINKTGMYCYSYTDQMKIQGMSIEEIRRIINKEEPIKDVVKRKITEQWNLKISKLGWDKEDGVQILNRKRWIHDGKVFEVETLNSYYDRHFGMILKCHNTSDVENLQFLELNYKVINIKDIQCFYKEGDIQYTAKITGGGGGGSSISGAIIGGLIAGDTGAVIGSRKKTESIQTNVLKHDERKTVLRYYEKEALIENTYNGFEMYEWLLKNIPDKDLMTINFKKQEEKNIQELDNTQKVLTDYREKLKVLKALYEEELINKLEYEEKKKHILQEL